MTTSRSWRRHPTLLWVAAFVVGAATAVAADRHEIGHGTTPPALPAPDALLDVDGIRASAAGEPGPLLSEPDREALRLLIDLDPSALGPLSIGSPDAGLLFNPQPMPEGPLWTIRNPAETFGTTETIAFVADVITEVARELPGSPRVVIGDISRRDGGRLNRHASHQVGRDVDLGFYYKTGETDRFFRPGRGQLDVARTWALVRAVVTRTDVNRIFLDRSLQRLLYDHAVEIGEDRDWLDDIFGRHTAGKGAIIQHVRRHADHMHIRFYNRRAQEWGRVAYPMLVQAGLVPGPTVTHRVRSGETLSLLSQRYGTSTTAIRAANGLRSSLIRAGKRYLIPVRRVPVESEPVVIPARRLPGALTATLQPDGDEPATDDVDSEETSEAPTEGDMDTRSDVDGEEAPYSDVDAPDAVTPDAVNPPADHVSSAGRI